MTRLSLIMCLFVLGSRTSLAQQMVTKTTPQELSWGAPAGFGAAITKKKIVVQNNQNVVLWEQFASATYGHVATYWWQMPGPGLPVPVFAYSHTLTLPQGTGILRYEVYRQVGNVHYMVNDFETAF